MNREKLIEILSKLAKYEMKEDNRFYYTSASMEKSEWGEFFKIEELAKAFGIEFSDFGEYNGEGKQRIHFK